MSCLLSTLGLTFSHLYTGMDTPVEDDVMDNLSVIQQHEEDDQMSMSPFSRLKGPNSIAGGLMKVISDVTHTIQRMKDKETCPEVIEDLEKSRSSLFQQKRNVQHMMNYNKLMGFKINELEKRLREMTYVVRSFKCKSLRPTRNVEDHELWDVYHKAATMLVGGNDVSDRVADKEVNGAHKRAIQTFNETKVWYAKRRTKRKGTTMCSSCGKRRDGTKPLRRLKEAV